MSKEKNWHRVNILPPLESRVPENFYLIRTATGFQLVVTDVNRNAIPLDSIKIHNDTTEKQGGDGVNYFHLGQTDYDKVQTLINGTTTEQWVSQQSAGDFGWSDVIYANSIFVSVASAGQVMTSPNGIDWTIRTAVGAQWTSIAYGNGIFVAVASFGNDIIQIMTSPDGIIWTGRTAPSNNQWLSVTFGNGIFVAISGVGASNRVMTSPDGITWTLRTEASNRVWSSVTFGNGLFVAVSIAEDIQRVMTSPDGITWTLRTASSINEWTSVTYGNNLFVAVSRNGIGNRVMTSPDGITWTGRVSAVDNDWQSVTFGNGKFVAVANSGTGNRVMVSTNGIDWVIETTPADNSWFGVTYGFNKFVAVATTGVGNRVMSTEITTTFENNSNNLVFMEDGFIYLNGQPNTFTLTGTPSSMLQVFRNGVKLKRDLSWVVSGNTVTITSLLENEDEIDISYFV